MDPAAGGFSEEQFQQTCAELQQPTLAGADWQLLVETLGISIYRLLDQVAAGLLEDSGVQRCGASLPAGSEGLQPLKSVPGGSSGAGRSERRGGASSGPCTELGVGGCPSSTSPLRSDGVGEGC